MGIMSSGFLQRTLLEPPARAASIDQRLGGYTVRQVQDTLTPCDYPITGYPDLTVQPVA